MSDAELARRVTEAQTVLKALGLPRAQCNERAALTLLGLLNLSYEKDWQAIENPLCGITPIIEFAARHYAKRWAPNTRETIRRYTMHQFVEAGLALRNPDDPARPVNSPRTVYQIEPVVRETLRTFGTPEWEDNLAAYRHLRQSLAERYAHERDLQRIPIQVAGGSMFALTPGGQNPLIRQILDEFAPRFVPGGILIYIGDAGSKFAHFDGETLEGLGVTVDVHGKMPDVILYWPVNDWLVLVEAVTHHGPIDGKRYGELRRLFAGARPGLVFVTAFPDRRTFGRYLAEIAWETEVWVAEAPSHLVHFNGSRFLGPYPEVAG